MDKNNFSSIRHKSLNILLAGCISLFGYGCGGSGGSGGSVTPTPTSTPVPAKPEVLVSGLANYEGSSSDFHLYAASPNGNIISASFSYSGKNVPLTRLAEGTYNGNLPSLTAGLYPFQGSAVDSSNLEGTINGSFDRYLVESNALGPISSILKTHLDNNNILAYWVTSQFETLDAGSTIIIPVHARIFDSSGYVALNYISEKGSIPVYHKNLLIRDGVRVVEINASSSSDSLSSRINQAQRNNFLTGIY